MRPLRFMRLPPWTLLALALFACAAGAQQRVLFEKLSPQGQGGIIVTQDQRGFRTLYFEKDGARQSVVKMGDPEHLELPYARAAMAGLALAPDPRRILVVGLGGGSLPMFLRRHYPQAVIDAVEIDPGVAEAARRWFGFREDERMKIRVADGRAFIEAAPAGQYDLVMLDAYGADSIPMSLATLEFLREVRRVLTDEGVVVANIWGPGSNLLYDAMARTYAEAFMELHVVSAPGSGNRIFLALPRRLALTREDLVRRAAAVSRSQKLRFDLAELVRDGYVEGAKPPPSARVLRDQPVPASRSESRPATAR